MTIYVSDTIQATAAPVTANPVSARSWQWNKNGAPIEGATSSSYQVVDADEGASIDVTQIESNIVGTAKATSNALGPVVPFEPIALYKNNTVGAWYDPSDMSTMFQDAAGTTPVTAVEQPVGLILDKSRELTLGPELVTNGTFDTDTWWEKNAGVSISGGVCNFTSVANTAGVYKTNLLSAGYFEFTYTVVSVSSGAVQCSVGPAKGVARSTPGTYTEKLATWIGGSSAGVTAVGTTTAVIDNVSIKQVAGNHAYQSTSTARPVFSRRYNLLTKTEQFDDAVWAKSGATSATASKIFATSNASVAFLQVIQTLNKDSASRTFVATIEAKEAELRYLGLTLQEPSSGINGVFSHTDLRDASQLAQGTFGSGFSLTSVQRTMLSDGYCRVTVTASTNAGATVTVGVQASKNSNFTSASYTAGEGLLVRNASLVPANQSSLPYQRVNTSTDYDSDPTKFPSYLRFDGVDDFLVTNTIDFTSTDKMTVFAGVRKLSDTTFPVICETYSASQSPNFSLHSSSSASVTGFAAGVGQTSGFWGVRESNRPSPATAVVTLNAFSKATNVSDALSLRVNGQNATLTNTSSSAISDTRNFASNSLYIGRRGGTTFPFNGYLYGLIVRGAQTNSLQIEKTEEWLANKTGITI